MIIVWSGLGILVPVVFALSFFGFEAVLEAFVEDETYCEMHGWPFFVSGLVTAAILWPLGTALKEGGHSLFFIPMRWWAVPALIVSVYMLIGPRDARSCPAASDEPVEAAVEVPYFASMYVRLSPQTRGEALRPQLWKQAAQARKYHLNSFVLLHSDSSLSCQALQEAMYEPDMQRALRGTFIVQLDVNEWPPEELDGEGFRQDRTLPVIYAFDGRGSATGAVFDASTWADNPPLQMTPALAKFFHPDGDEDYKPGVAIGRLLGD